MNHIILQHWAGNLPSWAKIASSTVKRYADHFNVDYELVEGYPLGQSLGTNPQKMYMLDQKYDKYDFVLMLDMDTIATKEFGNVFERPEIGVLHERAMIGPDRSRTPNCAPTLYTQGEPIFFGNHIKLTKNQRIELRKYADWDYFSKEIKDQYCGDEIILHYLFHKSGILKFDNYEDICMRCSGTSYENIHFRNYNRYDRKFCNQPEDSDNDATFIHFCASRKNNLEAYVKDHDL